MVLSLTETAPAGSQPPRPTTGATAGLAAGQPLGHFRIERQLGAGGMGEVYLATDVALDRAVAIKVLPQAVARDATRRERLIREARAQARVNHPNVAHIYFIGEDEGRLYFAMEHVAGATLTERIAQGPVPAEDALAIIRAAALGLREAHRSGFTHRDVKPSNLMIDAHGQVKLLDFGLAAGRGDEPHADERGSGPVAQTSIAGTPLYMAPEQGRGEPIDFRADIYALGATLYHLVSGRPPFEAETALALMSKHATAARPTLRRPSGQPRTTIAAIDRLCARMMAPDPADRFASYDELLRELELVSVERTRPAGGSVRAIATVVDLILSALLAGLMILAASALGMNTDDVNANALVLTVLAAYSIAALARLGRTFGQMLLELEVVDVATGGRPRLGQALLRVGLPLAIPLVMTWISFVLGLLDLELETGPSRMLALSLGLVPIALIWAAAAVPGKRTIWDKASKTLVRYRTRGA